jgi:hypothetical protein
MRSLAAFVAEHDPHILAIAEIDAGDALALATRFARQWAYRGRQALFWNGAFVEHAVHELYLPFRAANPFDRRALLRVDGALEGRSCALYATQFARAPEQCVPELRFVRERLCVQHGPAVLFAHQPGRQITFEDLGYVDALGNADGDERIYARGFFVEVTQCGAAPLGIGTPILARLAIA